MARTFRRHRAAHPIADLNITNLVDLAFVLLIVFMIATPLIQQEQTIPVNLPSLAKAPQTKSDTDDKFIAISIDASGRYYLEARPTPVSLTELQSALRAYAAEPKPPVIRIRGDGDALYKKVAEVLNEMKRAGLSRFTVDSEIAR